MFVLSVLLAPPTLPHRSSLIRYNSSTLPALSSSSLLLHQSSKSSESDLSTSTLPNVSSSSHVLSKLPLTQIDLGLLQDFSASSSDPASSSAPPCAPAQRQQKSQTSLTALPPRDVPPCGFNGCPANHALTPSSSRGPAGLVLPLGLEGSPLRGELVPVALGHSESGGLGFSVTAGGQGGQQAVVRRVWDRRQCPSLQAGDVVMKINGADVQSLSFTQVRHGHSDQQLRSHTEPPAPNLRFIK